MEPQFTYTHYENGKISGCNIQLGDESQFVNKKSFTSSLFKEAIEEFSKTIDMTPNKVFTLFNEFVSIEL